VCQKSYWHKVVDLLWNLWESIGVEITTPMNFRTFAIQPIAWGNFDEHGCEWAGDINTAFSIGKQWGERCMIWAVPNTGAPIKWCRCDEITDAIADLVFGC
jgi:hypothetical protein